MRGLIIAAMLAGSMVLAACGEGGEQPEAEELVVARSAIEALDNYAFTTELEISSAEGDLTASFDGAFQAPDRIQGRLTVTTELFDWLRRPSDMEVIVIPNEAWWREPDGEWQAGIAPGDSVDPLVVFAAYCTPRFYLEALEFDSLVLPLDDSLQEVNGVGAFRVRLDKPALIDLLSQATAIRQYLGEEPSPGYLGVQENAQQVLPEDVLVEAWFAEEGRYPVRLVITYSCDEVCALSFGFRSPLTVRLQMDITDPDADVEIAPPTT